MPDSEEPDGISPEEGLEITENYGIMSDTQVPEIRYVSSSDAAVSGDDVS